MPDRPIPGVKGHVVASPAAHASMSISSFAPAASTVGWLTSRASAGSFSLFCENGVARATDGDANVGGDHRRCGSKHRDCERHQPSSACDS